MSTALRVDDRALPRTGLALCALAAGALACAGLGAPGAPAGEAGAVVASVDGLEIHQAEVDAWLKDEIFEREFTARSPSERYELRLRAAQRMADQRVIEREAQRRGLSPEALLEREAAALGPVTDAEVEAFWQANEQRLAGGGDFAQWRPRIAQHLAQERGARALQALRERADVRIELEPPRLEVAAEGPARGPESASVTIVAFSDYQCPYCKRAEPTVRQVLERYPDQVRLVYRHLPLDAIHPHARGAAEAAVCAQAQGRFWEYHERVFESPRALTPDHLARLADELGLDTQAFQACLKLPETRERVQADVAAARTLGITGTPAFLVNGVLLKGARPLEDFVRLIDRELERRASPAAPADDAARSGS